MNTRLRCILFLFALAISVEASAQTPAEDSPEEFLLPVEEQRKLTIFDPARTSMEDLVLVYGHLDEAQKVNLGPLTELEVGELSLPDDAIPLNEKIGIIRDLPQPVTLTGLTSLAAAGRTDFAGGRLDITQQQRIIWTTAIESPGAAGIRLEIAGSNLPQQAKIYVTDGIAQVFGPYSLGSEPLWTHTVDGDNVYLQVQLPQDVSALATLAVSRIGHLTSSTTDHAAGPGGPAEELLMRAPSQCSVMEFCRPATPSKDPSQEQAILEVARLGVARINYQKGRGFYRCSGGLLRDTHDSGTPFFLTANHCFNSRASARSVEAYFRYWRVCDRNRAGSGERTLGSTLLATHPETDFTLVQLTERPPQGSHFFRWNPEDLPDTPTRVYRVHHPRGRPQHLQVSTTRVQAGCQNRPKGRYLYSNPQRGGTIKGSSGSLVFRINGDVPEVVGQLFGWCPDRRATCRYANVDGAFSRTYPRIRQYLEIPRP